MRGKLKLEENLFAPGTIRLIGAEFKGLTVTPDQFHKPEKGDPAAPCTSAPIVDVASKSRDGDGECGDPRLARIFFFTYEGHVHTLIRPTIFLVHGGGLPVFPAPDKPAASHGINFATIGNALQDYSVAEDLRMWAYDRLDYSFRIDLSTGWLQEILLDPDRGTAIVGRDGSAIGREGSAIGREGSAIGREGSAIGREGSAIPSGLFRR
jgi:hypothetical protein